MSKEEILEEFSPKIKFILKIVKIVAIIIFAIVLFKSTTFNVQEGSVAIISRFGKVVDVKEAGLNFKIPFIDKRTIMRTREQTVKFGEGEEFSSLRVTTKDMQTIWLDLTVSNITTDPLKVYKAFTGRQLQSMLLPRIKDAVQSNISKFTIEEFIVQRPKLADDILKDINSKTEKYGVVVTNVSIMNHKFSDVYANAVEQKKAAEQAVETEKAKQKQSVVEQETKAKTAEIEQRAKAKVAEIEQETKVKVAELRVKEKGLEAKANKVETESLSEVLLRKLTIEKWNGQMPTVVGNDKMLLPSSVIGR